jgi:hypothetical protein
MLFHIKFLTKWKLLSKKKYKYNLLKNWRKRLSAKLARFFSERESIYPILTERKIMVSRSAK